MHINPPVIFENGIRRYGYYFEFEVLRIDGTQAKIVDLMKKPERLNINDEVYYGVNGLYYRVLDIIQIRETIVVCKVEAI